MPSLSSIYQLRASSLIRFPSHNIIISSFLYKIILIHIAALFPLDRPTEMGDSEMAEFVGLWSVPPPQAQPPPQQKVPNRRFTAMEWEEQKPVIQRLYMEEDSTLPQVEQILS